ncbi:MAG: twin-arginine translocation signal domain-containing protein [Ilumatobacteraceae bacterium]|nr:twin-arginine translocation signal domain-containing protein [Ilumatobacteraceae bacterium]
MSEIHEDIKEVVSSRISRRRFVQGAAAVTAGAAVVGLAACGGSESEGETADTTPAEVKPLRIATGKQEHVAAPWETSGGSLFILSMVGEWLTWQLPDGSLEPRIAESWTASEDAKSWTFKIRQGVMFNDGTPLTVDDIVYTYTAIFDEAIHKGVSRSKGNYDNILDAAGVVKVDESTIQFNLLQANGNFPYFVSSACYGMCIIKKDAFGGAGWEETMIAAGPWKMVSHVNTESTVYEKNPYYWDTNFAPSFNTVELVQFVSAATALPQLQTGELDFIGAMEAADALALDEAEFTIATLPAGAGFAHVHMRTNFGPFQDKRIRQAAALTIDRPGYVDGIMMGIGGRVGNDSVMDPYNTADTSVPQRVKDIEKAKALMAEAGVPNGFAVDLSSWARDDINKYANLIKTSFAEIGIEVTLVIDGSDGGSAVYYTYDPYPSMPGKVNQFDNHSWLASNLGIVDWAGRGVPDQYLMREWRSTGDWSGAMLDSRVMDAAIDEYLQAITPEAKKVASKKIQEASLDETPYILAYTSNLITASRNSLTGMLVNGMGQFDARTATNA